MVRGAGEPHGVGEFRFEQTPSLDQFVRRCPEAGDDRRHDVSMATDSDRIDGDRLLVARARCTCGWEDSRHI